MNVLVFTTLFPNAAQPNHGLFVERRVLELQRRTGWTFDVVAPVPWFPFSGRRWGQYGTYARVPATETRNGLAVHHPRYLVIPRLTWRVAPVFLAAGAMRTLARLARASRYDVLDSHFLFPDGVAATLVGRRLGLPVVLTARGSDVNDSPRSWLPRLQLRRALRRAGALVAVARPLAEGLAKLTDGAREVAVLGNGVDPARFHPRDRAAAKRRYGLDGPVVLTVGNLRRLKGYHLVIEAVAGLPAVTLLVAGEGPERANLERQAAALASADRTRFLGAVPNADLPELYAAADVFVLASSSEGCPNVVLEAMACDVPVVSTPVGAVPDLLPVTGRRLLTRDRSAEAIREKIAEALAEPPPAGLYADRAAVFGWDETCARLADIFRSVAAA